MAKEAPRNKGVILFIVLATLFVVIILANIILTLISSQSRLTHHQISRIQAYYAARAGANYAFERLRSGSWAAGTDCPANEPCFLGDCPAQTTCSHANLDPDFSTAFPGSINRVRIVLRQQGDPGCDTTTTPAGINACISATANYTYTP